MNWLNDNEHSNNVTKQVITQVKPGHYIKFITRENHHHSNLSPILPYIDVQPVQLEPKVLLGGAGLYLKRPAGSWPLLSLKLITYNIFQKKSEILNNS